MTDHVGYESHVTGPRVGKSRNGYPKTLKTRSAEPPEGPEGSQQQLLRGERRHGRCVSLDPIRSTGMAK
jgi:hypothetical protein